MPIDPSSRDTLARSIGWGEAHLSLEAVVADLPPELRGLRPPGLPHSAWELVEHIRIAQQDILDFSTDGGYRDLNWPADYWPPSPEPPSEGAWDATLTAIREDREALERIVRDAGFDPAATVPNGTDQTYLREILLVVDHNAYHIGQLVVVRRLLEAWPPGATGR